MTPSERATPAHPSPAWLSRREAARRLIVYGPNELRRRGGTSWARELVRQVTHPLALLLWVAAALAALSGTVSLAVAIVAVIGLNAAFAFAQERQAERAVEALREYLPPHATVFRDGHRLRIEARDLVPGDLLAVEEGDRISADARVLDGTIEVDTSTLTGESTPQWRAPATDTAPTTGPALERPDLLFSGTVCTSGSARAQVVATGMHTELGRIAALSQRVTREESPLEHQVKRVAWLIALVAVVVGLAFLPLGVFVAGLSVHEATNFAIGLIVANVPEGLLPTITLALAVGVRALARKAALVKRLSAVETLGSTTVICTDKTGTLTQNRLRTVEAWTLAGPFDVDGRSGIETRAGVDAALPLMAIAMAAANNAALGAPGESRSGDPTELAMLEIARDAGVDVDEGARLQRRVAEFPFDPALRLMSTVDQTDAGLVVHAKGAPEDVLARSRTMSTEAGDEVVVDEKLRASIGVAADRMAADGLRVLAVARRPLGRTAKAPATRDDAERDLSFLGLVGMLDPPRPEVADAVRSCHRAGVRILVVTGDAGLTAAAVARRVGIGTDTLRVVGGQELDAMTEAGLDRLLREEAEIVFARSSPEAKLRITDALRAEGHVVAMTGDGVNDAPALRRADIGVAMGVSGTDVAQEAATMILSDDNFASIVAAVEGGRRVYDNVRKFILYIFAHATPEIAPFLVFALSGGTIPLPLTVLQILAIDLGTETLPALALGCEPAEPGLMDRPPRRRSESVINRELLVRAWLFLGLISAALVMGGFFYVLRSAGWHPGNSVSGRFHDAYLRATTMTFAGIVACQVGTAFAARTDRSSLRTVGFATNRLLLWGIAFELVFAGLVIYLPPLQGPFHTAPLGGTELAILACFPPIVWGADELRRWRRRRRTPRPT